LRPGEDGPSPQPDLVLCGGGLATCGAAAPSAGRAEQPSRSSPIGELENALKGFVGALIVASHDEAFLRAIGSSREIALVQAVYL
jgi:hypothetical protein